MSESAIESAGNPNGLIQEGDGTRIGNLRRRSIFDLTEMEVGRLKLMAEMLASSGFNHGNNRQSQSDYFLIMLKGAELGFTPMAAVDNISVVYGKPTLDGKGMLALIHASGLLDNMDIKGDDKSCTCMMWRKGNETPTEITFSIQDAEKLGLVNKKGSQYKSQPATMLRWRAIANCARIAFPDVLGGVYTVEELISERVQVSEDGSMRAKALPAPTQQIEAPKQAQPKAAAKKPAKTKDNVTPMPTTAGEAFLKDSSGKTRFLNWLKSEGFNPSKPDEYSFLLDKHHVQKFGDIPIPNEKGFYADLNAQLADIRGENKDADDDAVYVVKNIEFLEYDGDRIVISIFHPTVNSVRAFCYSRKDFAEMVGAEYADAYDIPNLEPIGAINVDRLAIYFKVKHRKTGSKSRYGIIVDAIPVDPEGELVREPKFPDADTGKEDPADFVEPENPIDEFFGDDDEEGDA